MTSYKPGGSASRAALIYLLEPVFGGMASIAWQHDKLSVHLVAGGVMIVGGNLLAELPGILRARMGVSRYNVSAALRPGGARAMSTVTLEDAQAKLRELIEGLALGEEVIITRNAQPVAKLVGQISLKPQPIFGRGRGKVIVVAEDDEHLKDFEDYMP